MARMCQEIRHLLARSNGSNLDDWLTKQCHIFALITGSNWDEYNPKNDA
jgi:hypothetical protein